MYYTRAIVLYLLTFSSIAYVHGQQSPEVVNLSFENIAWESAIDEIYYMNDGSPYEIKLMPFQLSGSYKYKGPATLVFYRQLQQDDGKVVRQTVGQVSVPASSSDMLLLWFPQSDGGYRIFPLSGKMPEEDKSVCLFNASSIQMAVQLFDSTRTLEPGQSLPLEAENGMVAVNVAYLDQRDNEWKIAFNNIYRQPRKGQRIVFLTTSNSDKLKLQTEDGEAIVNSPIEAFSIVR